MAGPTYLVLTAADAAAHNAAHPHDIVSLNQLLEVRARDQADTVCVGFVTRVDGTFGCETLSELLLKQAMRGTKRAETCLNTMCVRLPFLMPISFQAAPRRSVRNSVPTPPCENWPIHPCTNKRRSRASSACATGPKLS